MEFSEVIIIERVLKTMIDNVSESITPTLQEFDPAITGVHCLIGGPDEIKRRLQLLDSGVTTGNEKFPLVAIIQDFPEVKGGEFFAEVSLQILILHLTTKAAYLEDRLTNVFEPVLYPIYFDLLRELKESKFTTFMSEDRISHVKISRPHFGNPEQYKEAYPFVDPLDCIELQNLKINFTSSNCKTSNNGRIKTGMRRG